MLQLQPNFKQLISAIIYQWGVFISSSHELPIDAAVFHSVLEACYPGSSVCVCESQSVCVCVLSKALAES